MVPPNILIRRGEPQAIPPFGDVISIGRVDPLAPLGERAEDKAADGQDKEEPAHPVSQEPHEIPACSGGQLERFVRRPRCTQNQSPNTALTTQQPRPWKKRNECEWQGQTAEDDSRHGQGQAAEDDSRHGRLSSPILTTTDPEQRDDSEDHRQQTNYTQRKYQAQEPETGRHSSRITEWVQAHP
jgi:hypothetical protein